MTKNEIENALNVYRDIYSRVFDILKKVESTDKRILYRGWHISDINNCYIGNLIISMFQDFIIATWKVEDNIFVRFYIPLDVFNSDDAFEKWLNQYQENIKGENNG